MSRLLRVDPKLAPLDGAVVATFIGVSFYSVGMDFHTFGWTSLVWLCLLAAIGFTWWKKPLWWPQVEGVAQLVFSASLFLVGPSLVAFVGEQWGVNQNVKNVLSAIWFVLLIWYLLSFTKLDAVDSSESDK